MPCGSPRCGSLNIAGCHAMLKSLEMSKFDNSASTYASTTDSRYTPIKAKILRSRWRRYTSFRRWNRS